MITQFALIGCGRIAERHLPHMVRTGKLAAVCDVDPQRAALLAAPAGAKVYTCLDSLLINEPHVAVVVVCTPNGLHAEHVIKSLQARRHVLCEKPLCMQTAAALTMRDTAYFFRRSLFVVKQNRFNPPVLAVKEALEQNVLGKILSFSINGFWNRPQEYYTGSWQGTLHLDGGILYTQFSHFIDLLLWLLGPVATVKAAAQNNGLRRNFSIEDTFVALLQLQSGALGTVHLSINSQPQAQEGAFTIIGEKGTVRIGGPYLNTLEWFLAGNTAIPEKSSFAEERQNAYPTHKSNHGAVYDELQKALARQPHCLPQVQEAVQAIELIEKLYAAARN